MSRSYRRHFYKKCIFKGSKKAAARAFRRYKRALSSGCSYKKLYNSWDVVDLVYFEPNTLKKIKQFKLLCDELFENEIDKHLTKQEFEEIIDDLEGLSWYFKVRNK